MPGRIGLSIINSARSNDGARQSNTPVSYIYVYMCCTLLELRQVIINPWISHAYSHPPCLFLKNHADHISSLNLTPTGGRRCERWRSEIRECNFCGDVIYNLAIKRKGKERKRDSSFIFRWPLTAAGLTAGPGDPADTLLITLLIMCTPFFDHSNNNRQKHQWKQTARRSGYFFFSSLLDFLSAHFPPSYPPHVVYVSPAHAIIPMIFFFYI